MPPMRNIARPIRTHRTPRAARLTLVAVLALGSTGCFTDSVAPVPYTPAPTTLQIADPGALRVGDAVELTATVKDQQLQTMPNVTVQFAVTDPTVASITAGRVLTALREGTTDIVAIAGSGTQTVQQRRTVSVQARATPATVRYPVQRIDNATLPAIVYQEDITRDDGSSYTLIERLEAGEIVMGDRYEVRLTVADIERYSLQGNVIERVMRRRTVRDDGLVYYNWLNGSAQLISTSVGGLSHTLTTSGQQLQLAFRIGGTNTIWSLTARLPQ